MKKCHYCAKEIEYSEMYCSKECEDKSNNCYKTRLKWRIPVNISYIISILLIGIGVLFSPTTFSFWGILGVAVGGILSGVITLVIPAPTEDMIKKHKMLKAQNRFRIYGAVLLAVGIVALILDIIKLCL